MTKVMTKLNARQRILAYLHGHPGVSAQELSRALQVTPANIRHHLAILLGDGRARVVGTRQPAGRGRPLQVFGPGELAGGDNLSELTDALLATWLEALPPGRQDQALQSLAARLAAVAPGPQRETITRRLALAMERLNSLHYQARWEAHAQGPQVIFERCPYAAILPGHPELCRLDALLLAALLGSEPVQTARLELNARGMPFCQFRI